MRVHGDVKPSEWTAESCPNKPGTALVRFCLNPVEETADERTGWVYDEYTVEVQDGEDLQERVAEQFDDLLLRAAYGWLSLDDLRAQRIAESKKALAEWLASHPLTWTDGKQYAVTQEKQSQLTSTLAVQQVAQAAGVTRKLKWNTTGDECTEWTYEELCALALAIADYVELRVSAQQAAEVAIRDAETAQEVLTVVWDYDTPETA